MAKPWEKYQATAPAAATVAPVVAEVPAAKPWEQYAVEPLQAVADVPAGAQLPVPAAEDPAISQDAFGQFKDLLLRQAKGETGLEGQISELQTQLSTQQAAREPREIPQPDPDGVQVPWAVDLFTGEARMTPELEALPNLGEAPEFNEMSGRAFKANIGTFTTGDPDELQTIFKEQYGEDVTFTKDSKGNPIVNFPSGSYALNKPGASPQDIPKFFGDLLAFSPAGRARTVTSAAAKSMFGEAILEGVDVAVGGDFKIEDIAEAAVLGGLFKSAEDAMGFIYRNLKGKGLPEQTQLLREAEEAGIPIKTTDVLPPETFAGKTAQQITEKIPVVGTGAAREQQQQLRQSAVEKIVEQYNAPSYEGIVQSLKDQKSKVKKAAGNVIGATAEKLDAVGTVSIDNTETAIINALDELNKPGVIQSGKATADLDELIRAIDEAPQTYTSLKENRTAFREILNSLDPTSRSQLTSKAKSDLNKVYTAMTKDMAEFAEQNLPAIEVVKLNKANRIYAEEATKLTKTKLKNILDKGDVTPESVKPMLYSKNLSETKLLYNSLTNEGRGNARAAIISKIAEDLSRRAGGITPNAFVNELKKYPNQMSVFFKGRDKKQLEGLRRVLEVTKRAQEASVSTPTGQQLIPLLTGGAAIAEPVTTAVAAVSIGSLARLYESPAVRNALLKLAGTRKGSTQFEQALADARQLLSVGAQATRGQEIGQQAPQE